MGNNSVPKFILRLSRFPVYRGSVLGRFYCNMGSARSDSRRCAFVQESAEIPTSEKHSCRTLTLTCMVKLDLLLFYGATAASGPAPQHWGFMITLRRTTLGRTPLDGWSEAETSTWQYTTVTTNRHPCPRWDSNPQSQQAIGRRPTPYSAGPLGTGICSFHILNSNSSPTIKYYPKVLHSSPDTVWHTSSHTTHVHTPNVKLLDHHIDFYIFNKF